jgi:hypothetical protein
VTVIGQPIQLLRFWYAQRIAGYSLPDSPWFEPETFGCFQELLAGSRLYVEFGSGGSTLLADRLGIETISIESDRYYARVIRSGLSQNSRVKVVHADIGATGPYGYPLLRRPTPPRVARWLDYASRPFEMLGEAVPDFVLVDGRFRIACALASLRRAALAGADMAILVDDYFKPNRSSYAAIESFAGAPQRAGTAAVFGVRRGRLVECPSERDMALAIRDPR